MGAVPPPQANATGHGAVPVGVPEGQQTAPMALRNQLETIIGDLRLAYGRLGQLPPEAMEPSTFGSLQSQYALLMDIAGQLTGRLNNLGPALGEDLGLSKEINTLHDSYIDKSLYDEIARKGLKRAVKLLQKTQNQYLDEREPYPVDLNTGRALQWLE